MRNEDLTTLDPPSLQEILREIDMRDLAVSLKSASEKFKTALLSCISKRATETGRDGLHGAAQAEGHRSGVSSKWSAGSKARARSNWTAAKAMNPTRETLKFATPLRAVTLVRSGDHETVRQQELQASYERGRLEGERALSEQLVRQRAEVMELQTGVLASLRDAVPQATRECERALVTLALEAAQRFVAGLPISPEMIAASVEEACAEVEDTADFTVQLHPEDLALLQRTNSPLLLPQGGNERIHFQTSSQVTRGGCVVQTRFGVIDARRETRFEILQKVLAP